MRRKEKYVSRWMLILVTASYEVWAAFVCVCVHLVLVNITQGDDSTFLSVFLVVTALGSVI